MDQLCWTLVCKLAQEFVDPEDQDRRKLERLGLYEKGEQCVAAFAPLLGRAIKKGPPKDGAWLFKLALCR